MAREVHERENLLRDAVALTPRIQLRDVANDGVEIFAGFRGDCLSLYFDDDPAYHFNSSGELRRAYDKGSLIKAERGRLVAMRREQSTEKSNLVRSAWDVNATREFLDRLGQRLSQLEDALSRGALELVGQVPGDGDALGRLIRWLANRPMLSIAATPRVG